MGAASGVRVSRWFLPGGPGSRVTRLELLWDLIFVFAFLNVTTLVGKDPTVRTLAAGAVVLGLLWWCWSGFAALGNIVRADQGALPLVGFAVMAAAFVLSLTIPQAFVDEPGELRGPVVFAVAYLAVRALTVGALWFVIAPGTVARRRLRAYTNATLAAAVLIVIAALTPLWLADTRAVAWTRLGWWSIALIMESLAARSPPYPSWAGLSAGHWAERHALIVLVALGETIISLGLGAGTLTDLTLTVATVVAAVLGIALVASLWWLHFDTLAAAVEQALHSLRDERRLALTRDVHTYLHVALIAGIIATALGLKLTLRALDTPSDPLSPFGARVLYLGVVLFLLAEIATSARTFRAVPGGVLLTTGALAVAAFVAHRVPALAALAALVAVTAGLALAQRLRYAAERQQVRRSALEEDEALEAALSRWRIQHR